MVGREGTDVLEGEVRIEHGCSGSTGGRTSFLFALYSMINPPYSIV